MLNEINGNDYACSRIATDASSPIDQHQFAQARKSETVLGVLVGQIHRLFFKSP